MAKIKPTLVLTIISTIIAALLIVVSTVLAVDPSVLSEAMKEKSKSIFGEGDYRIVSDWQEEGYKIAKPDDVKNLIVNEKGDVILQVAANGYEKAGINLLIGMNPDGSVKGIAVVEILETPGLGSKVGNQSFIDQFVGAKEDIVIVKKAPAADNEIQAITSATYSSKGMAKAINTAINTYKEMGVMS